MRNRFSPAGQFFVLAMLLFATVVCLPGASWAQNFKFSTLYVFKNNGTDPSTPAGFLILDSAGNLYGESLAGGTSDFGTVFEITSRGKLSVLHNFQGAPNDGEGGQGLPAPTVGLARDSAGNLYGTTAQGGNSTGCDRGCGVAFKLTPAGEETILHNFGPTEGPSNVILDPNGNLYGTTFNDGVNASGTVFEIKGGKYTVLYNFCSVANCEDGEFPDSGLVRDAAGNLYGVTLQGGAADEGTVFKVTPSGVETVLHSFLGPPTDGGRPEGNLKQDNKGNLYGTTFEGGLNDAGALFKQPEDGSADTILYSFFTLPHGTDGFNPLGSVQIDKSGNFYGTATGSDLDSVVWEVTSSGEEKVLKTLGDGMGGLNGLVIDANGNLYGTTTGQDTTPGSVFKLTLVK